MGKKEKGKLSNYNFRDERQVTAICAIRGVTCFI